MGKRLTTPALVRCAYLVVWLSAGNAACSSQGGDGRFNHEAATRTLQTQREKWASRKLDSYDFHYEEHARRSMFALGRVEVRDGVARYTELDQDDSGQRRHSDSAPTIETLFEGVAEYIRWYPDELSVIYDTEYGFPNSVDVRYGAGEFEGYSISDFDPRTLTQPTPPSR